MDKTYAKRLHRYEMVLRGFFLNALRLQIKPYKDFYNQNGYLGSPELLIAPDAFLRAYSDSYRFISDAEMYPEWLRQDVDYKKSQKDFSVEDGFLIISETLKSFFVQASLTNYNTIRDELNDTTISAINDFVNKARLSGSTDAEIIKAMSTVFEDKLRTRSTLIGSTEANTILGLVKRQTSSAYFNQRGVVGYKTWFTRRDERVRRTHIEVDGRTLPIDTKYVLNNPRGGVELADFPCQHTLSAANRVHCRCYLEYHSDPNKFKR